MTNPEQPQNEVFKLADQILALKRALITARRDEREEQIIELEKQIAELDAKRKALEEQP